jgi:cyclic lactone autoinducer peptide
MNIIFTILAKLFASFAFSGVAMNSIFLWYEPQIPSELVTEEGKLQ